VQSKKLLEYFNADGAKRAILVREPGGTNYGEALRALIKHPEKTIRLIASGFSGHEDFPQELDLGDDFSRSPYCELFMFAAARAEFVDKIVLPALHDGLIVICDRFYDSTTAYQGGGQFHHDELMLQVIGDINQIAARSKTPNLTIFIDISVDTMIGRRQKVQDKDAHFEITCDRDFFERTRDAYQRIAIREPNRFKTVDGHQTIEQVWQDILKLTQTIT
jgi:dTMP kinase